MLDRALVKLLADSVQGKPWRRADGVYLYFEDNAGVVSAYFRW